MDYKPKGPYRLKSGDYEGKALEWLMFYHYRWVFNQLEIRDKKYQGKKEKKQIHKHLRWLIEKGKTRETKVKCSECRERPATHFLVIYSGNDFRIETFYRPCEECKPNLDYKLSRAIVEKRWKLLPFTFSTMARREFRRKIDRQRIGDVFRWAFGLPTRPDPLTADKAFKFFKQPP